MQLIIIALCHRVPKDEDLSRRHDTTPRHQEYDKKMLESLLKEVISDELSKMSKSILYLFSHNRLIGLCFRINI